MLDPECLEHRLRLEIGGPQRDGLAVPDRPMVNDLDGRVRPGNADVKHRHDVALLGDDVVVTKPSEIEHVGNTWQYMVSKERCPDVSTAPGKVVGRGYGEVGMQICCKLVRRPWTPAWKYSSTTALLRSVSD